MGYKLDCSKNAFSPKGTYEFFIVCNPLGLHHLDGEHTVFGEVTKGMDVVDKIAKVKIDEGEWPIQDIEIKVRVF